MDLLERLREAGMAEAGTVVAMAEDGADRLQRRPPRARGVRHPRCHRLGREPRRQSAHSANPGVRIVNPQYSTLLMLEGLVINPAALPVGADPGADQEVQVIKLQNQSLVGRSSSISACRAACGCSHRARRSDAGPGDGDGVQANDTLTLSGEKSEVDACARLFARR